MNINRMIRSFLVFVCLYLMLLLYLTFKRVSFIFIPMHTAIMKCARIIYHLYVGPKVSCKPERFVEIIHYIAVLTWDPQYALTADRDRNVKKESATFFSGWSPTHTILETM